MRYLAIYSIIIGIVFAAFSIYYASIGDNAPLWMIIFIVDLPIIVFGLLYLIKRR